MQTQLVKWGNGQGFRIPKNIMSELDAQLNDTFTITIDHNRIILEKNFRHQSLEERAAKSGGSLGPYTEFNWGEPEGSELW
ncbi:MAG: AbrB/MazE/SpoVT family DNA-binding domain-containing protein [Lachnospiraceae bacterium]|nr:AbrB/MazE/SpoVT family DNA-binding domain-containing protein [Lachnospiraceae bacterium]